MGDLQAYSRLTAVRVSHFDPCLLGEVYDLQAYSFFLLLLLLNINRNSRNFSGEVGPGFRCKPVSPRLPLTNVRPNGLQPGCKPVVSRVRSCKSSRPKNDVRRLTNRRPRGGFDRMVYSPSGFVQNLSKNGLSDYIKNT